MGDQECKLIAFVARTGTDKYIRYESDDRVTRQAVKGQNHDRDGGKCHA